MDSTTVHSAFGSLAARPVVGSQAVRLDDAGASRGRWTDRRRVWCRSTCT